MKNKVTSINNIMLVGAPLPSGMLLIVNILLELNIKTTIKIPKYQDDKSDIWDEKSGKSFYIHEGEYVKLLPILSRTRCFEFQENIEIFWTHSTFNTGDKVLFIHRDPRDAIYSYHKRNYKENDMSFDDFYKRSDIWPHHFENLFFLPPAETYIAYSYYWKSITKKNKFHQIKFEDAKLRPFKTVKNILQFIEVKRSKEAIETAISNSHISLIDTKNTTHARKGAINEWEKVFSMEQKEYFGSKNFEKYANEFGYKYKRNKQSQNKYSLYLKANRKFIYLFLSNIKYCFRKDSTITLADFSLKDYTCLLLSHWLVQLLSRDKINFPNRIKILYNFSCFLSLYKSNNTKTDLIQVLKVIYRLQ